MNSRSELLSGLKNIIGLRLSEAAHAADMRGVGFRSISEHEQTNWFLHICCSWRIESGDRIVTGSFDWMEPEVADSDPGESWDPASGGSLQEARLRSLLQDPDRSRRTISNQSNLFVVKQIEVDGFGGCTVQFTDGLLLRVFPAGARGEFWRLFKKNDDRHWVSGTDSQT